MTELSNVIIIVIPLMSKYAKKSRKKMVNTPNQTVPFKDFPFFLRIALAENMSKAHRNLIKLLLM